MLFNSLQFLAYFVVVTSAYFIMPHKYRGMWLLVCSCYFYMAFIPVYILILGFTIVIDYIAGIMIERSNETGGKRSRQYLIMSIIANVGVLSVFKYYNFFIDNTNWIFSLTGTHPIPHLNIILPIGLSFHTFQAMSYTIEVYRGRQKAEKHFGLYALYVMFYPQLVAGPIERPQNLLHQFREKHLFEYQRVADGLKLMAWGMFKKVVIADRLAEMVNYVYGNPTASTGVPLILATVFFSIQIYCDFSGYSDIAIGAAQVMGFKLMKNFNRPYFSKTISEFWSRWHISLSTWFRDYLYIPLGGNRVRKSRWYFNLLITFLISGLWHGANWNFIIWGGIHGIYLIMGILLIPVKDSISKSLNFTWSKNVFKVTNILTIFILVSFAWIFFRANTFADAKYIISHLFSSLSEQFQNIKYRDEEYLKRTFYLGTTAWNTIIAVLSIYFLFTVELMERKEYFRERITTAPAMVKWACYSGIILITLYFGVFNKNIQFIYFQF